MRKRGAKKSTHIKSQGEQVTVCPVCNAKGDEPCINQNNGSDMIGRHAGRA